MMPKKVSLIVLEEVFAICTIPGCRVLPTWAINTTFFSVTKTHDELSIVCPQHYVPENIDYNRDWRALKIKGPLDFSLIGILAQISTCLAKASISIFALSTYETDYILVKNHDLNHAISTLREHGYKV